MNSTSAIYWLASFGNVKLVNFEAIMWLRINKIMSPPFLFRSNLNGVLKLSTLN